MIFLQISIPKQTLSAWPGKMHAGRSHKEKLSFIHDYLKKTYGTNNNWVVIVYDDIWLYKNHFMTGYYIHLFRTGESNIFASRIPKTKPRPNLFRLAVTIGFDTNNHAESLGQNIWKFMVERKMPVRSIIVIRKGTTVYAKQTFHPQRLFSFVSRNFYIFIF
jgi:hypothetical protein